MAIQGSTASFPVGGLLEFLATTGRTGRLVVHARPQVGLVAVRAGRLVAAGLCQGDGLPDLATAPDPTTLGGIVSDLLTLPAGRFAFHPDGVTGTASGFGVDEVLTVARLLEHEHGDASEVGEEHRVSPVLEPAFETVALTEEHWAVLTTVGDGATVADLAAELGLGLAAVRRRLDALQRLGLVAVDGPVGAS